MNQIKILSQLPPNTYIDYLFWIGCSGSYDKRIQNIIKAVCLILDKANISFAILGEEEMCTGDPVRRAGNEFLFQMMAQQNIATLERYQIKKIITTCPHCFNTLKNEYAPLGGHYEVIHHATLIQELIDKGVISCKENTAFKGKKITYHDSCYLGRANAIYDAPRYILEHLDTALYEAKNCRKSGLCCGAGGAQLFKEEESGSQSINQLRYDELKETKASIIATACPFCMTMFNDASKKSNTQLEILDIAELVAQSLNT